MAKLFFNYSVMNAGKSTQLLNVRYTYIDHGGRVLLFTSAVDDRSGVGMVKARGGGEAEAYALTPEDNIFDIVSASHEEQEVSAVLVDEVQFLTAEHVMQMSDVADYLDIPVMAYGLKNNSLGTLFSSAVEALLALANEFNEIKQICHCGSKATMILKYNPDGSIVREGAVVETGGESRYMSVCRPHWKEGNIGPRNRKAIFDAGYGMRVTCQTCGNQHPVIFDDIEQGNDCAARVTGDRVSGYYGSAVADGCTFKFVGGIPTNARQGVICDPCLRKFIADGSLVKTSSWFEGEPGEDDEEDVDELVGSGEEERA